MFSENLVKARSLLLGSTGSNDQGVALVAASIFWVTVAFLTPQSNLAILLFTKHFCLLIGYFIIDYFQTILLVPCKPNEMEVYRAP